MHLRKFIFSLLIAYILIHFLMIGFTNGQYVNLFNKLHYYEIEIHNNWVRAYSN